MNLDQDVAVSPLTTDGLCLPTGNSHAPSALELIPTGILPLDHELGGGIRPGTLNLACAYTGDGKTSLMIHLAQTAAHLGHPVRIYHSEMDTANDYLPRVARWQIGPEFRGSIQPLAFPLIKIEDIRHHPDRGLAAITRDIRALKAEQKLTPVIIVDSLDRPGDDRLQLEQFARYLTDLTEAQGVVTWATSQANDKARETDTVTMQQLRDSRGKAFPCSLFIGLRKISDLVQDGNAVLTIDKSRYGQKFQVRVRVDWAAQRFSDVDDTYQLPANVSTRTTRQICVPGDKSA